MKMLLGPCLLGFGAFFDTSGDPSTPEPYPVVVPSAVGPVLLPFVCPHCGAVCDGVVDPDRRTQFYDVDRKFSWCPKCKGRFFVDRVGCPLEVTLMPGARSAPARVRRAGVEVSAARQLVTGDLEMLGSI